MDNITGDTPVENEPILEILGSKDEHQVPQHIEEEEDMEDMEPQSMPPTSPSEEPRTTTAAPEPPSTASFPADLLAGVGSAYTTTYFEIPQANLDDDLTIEMTTTTTHHNDRIVLNNASTIPYDSG